VAAVSLSAAVLPGWFWPVGRFARPFAPLLDRSTDQGAYSTTTLPSGNLRAGGVGLPRHPGEAKPAGPGGECQLQAPRKHDRFSPTMGPGVDIPLLVWLPCGRLGAEGDRLRPTAKPSHAAAASHTAKPISLGIRPAGGVFDFACRFLPFAVHCSFLSSSAVLPRPPKGRQKPGRPDSITSEEPHLSP
jgi:hypothetical protein